MTVSDFGIVKKDDHGELWMLVWRKSDGTFRPAQPEEIGAEG